MRVRPHRPVPAAVVLVVTALVTAALTAPVPAGAALPTLGDDGGAWVTDSAGLTALAKARADAAAMEQQRLRELTSQGMSPEEAGEQLLAEQREAAERIRHRILELTVMYGMTGQEIADATPGLILVSETAEPVGIMSSNSDVDLFDLRHFFFMQCGCDELDVSWEHVRDMEDDAQDVISIRITENVLNLGGSIFHCDAGPSPDQCHSSNDLDFEGDPNGVAHDFMSEEGEYGTMAMTAKQYSGDGPGPCQFFAHYHHAWSNVVVTGVSISTGDVSVSFGLEEHVWEQSDPGPGVSC